MKKTIALILALCMVASLITACSGDEQQLSSTQPNNVSGSSTEEPEAPAETEAPEVQTEIAEAVLYDNNGYKVTVTGIDNGSIFGKEINLLVENTTDKNVALSGDTFVVNGIAMYGMLYIEVAAGKKANGSLTLLQDDLDVAGVEDIVNVVAYDAHIVDTDSYDILCDVPMDITTTSTYQQVIDDSGEVVFDENGITVIAKTISENLFGKTAVLFVKNNSGSDIYAQAENVSVNGFTISAWMYDIVPDGTVRFSDLGIYESELEENGITDIEEITFTISAINPDSYSTVAQSDEIQVFAAE